MPQVHWTPHCPQTQHVILLLKLCSATQLVSPEDRSEEHVPWQRRHLLHGHWEYMVRGDQNHQEVQRWFPEGQGDKRRVGQALYIYGEDKAVQITMLAISTAIPRIRSY